VGISPHHWAVGNVSANHWVPTATIIMYQTLVTNPGHLQLMGSGSNQPVATAAS